MVITNTSRRDSGGSEYAREINVNQHRQEGMRDCSDVIRNANDKVSNSGWQKNKYGEIGGMELEAKMRGEWYSSRDVSK